MWASYGHTTGDVESNGAKFRVLWLHSVTSGTGYLVNSSGQSHHYQLDPGLPESAIALIIFCVVYN